MDAGNMANVASFGRVLGASRNVLIPACPSSSKKTMADVSSVAFPSLSFPADSESQRLSPSSSLSLSLSTGAGFHGKTLKGGGGLQPVHAQATYTISKAMRWWEKGLQSNMKEVESAEDLVDSLLSAGNKLVVVDFFSPGCGGCRALHPKICQFAEMNPEVLFLQINYEQHKTMCYSLNVHVLPFFRFYRGAHGRVSSFSCTNATIKKFKDAMTKHNTETCSLGPAKGLEEEELFSLASNKDLSFNYTKKPEPATLVFNELELTPPVHQTSLTSEEKDLAATTSWR